MPSFKMTIPEGTNLWNAIGALPSKARNAELYRLAASGLIADGRPQRADIEQVEPVKRGETKLVSQPVEECNFVNIDLENDLQGFLSGNL